ncbi:Pyruvate dehydrogenase E1 component subunit alpha, mitochondrial [Schizosaccharomyces pombe]|uniref:Pyruvate dehydrogenase E1 component subunit alpha, mitochondrial n=1 Tax=Schizosaccharomyces pombe (strain 972 / ATCC 24843) TaxID=284812 RepID=ODPA_SCHPO|nr:putative pyruvate dehydrogenase e1 component alpha subunit Pda1 [Schizosaccharomyces pombe]Q10489.1 RecName: Full=Pyruvate dehydrogenase E1 component subunit alpha, mitochondrial; Short=PDHE1-A; Flags: Precursor [Schizosaccharomyces pombe 972h-]CAA97360.1 pyruvate dehydrogenase e1 component alpha subunit Pda1 (predicted) [Schizosaccharomyces pombe]|eukprot:NP_594892.1 putative pyruvate dehydrogenase e1 component alpha subunit Pda1 [Schizosaccharomyces pombe]
MFRTCTKIGTVPKVLVNQKGLIDGLRRVTTDATTSRANPAHVPEEHDKPFPVKLDDSVFEGYKIDVPSTEIEVTKGELLGLYEKMVTIRRLELACDALYKAKKIRGFCHLSIGQEAVAAGIEGAITLDDSIITSYRCHGFAYTRGLSIRSIIGELMGRQCGASKGKGGSMHIFAKNFYGGNGIVGAQIPLGAGIGFAQKYLEKPTTTFALYGDGASNQGQAFEAFNMAKLWGLPVIFACENNKYGMGTSAERSSAMTEFYKRGQYIPGLLVNGMDVLAVLQASKFAKKYTVENSQPLLMEFVTYRYGGHSMSDPGTTYRSREEVQKVRAARDPIEGLKKHIMEWGVANANELKNIEKRIRGMVDEEVRIAEESPFPDPIEESLFSDVYVAGTEPAYARGRNSLEYHQYK